MREKASICIADDDCDVLKSLSLLVRAFGYHVIPYASGSDLLADLGNQRPDCLVIDQRMPGMLGSEIVSELRSRGCNVPVVLMSGHATAQLIGKVDDLSVQLLEKPVTKDRLEAVLRQAVGQKA